MYVYVRMYDRLLPPSRVVMHKVVVLVEFQTLLKTLMYIGIHGRNRSVSIQEQHNCSLTVR